jgi:acetyl coenzyme A synthetase (ADP forming)-like protein
MGEADTRWESDVPLADGRTIRVRPARPEDADALRAFHAALSPETVYLRYFSAKPRLSPRFVETFTHVDLDRHAVIFAWSEDALVGMASYDRLAETDAAEVAVVVSDAHHGRGIGTVLLEHLVAIASEHQIRRLVADTLPHNQAMLRVFADSGFEVERSFKDGVAHVCFEIDHRPAATARIEAREHAAESISVARLLAPRSVAIIGAGRSPAGLGRQVLRNLLRFGFTGSIYPVHPEAPELEGLRAYPRCADIPDDVDLGVIVVPAPSVLDVARDLAAKGARGLVVISAGFSEAGPEGAARERELLDLVRRNGMRLVGPNCIGVVNTAPSVRLDATFAPMLPEPGRIGFLSQSGALGVAVLDRCRKLGLGISTFVSAGNKADISGNDLLQYWEDDAATDLVLLYLESFGNPRKFSRIARRVARAKPIVAVKAARGAAGTRAAASHTAAAAAPDLVVDALFRQTGVIRVDTLAELFDVARLLALQPAPPGMRVAVLGNSGGPGVLAADACEAERLLVAELSAATQASLRARVPSAAAFANPIDLLASASPGDYEAALRAVLADPAIDAALVIFTGAGRAHRDAVAGAIARAAGDAGPKPVLACFVADAELAAIDAAPGGTRRVPVYDFPEPAVRALAHAARWSEWRTHPTGSVPRFADLAPDAGRAVVAAELERAPAGGWLRFGAAQQILAGHGIPVVRTQRVASEAEAVAAAAAFGAAVALKCAAPDLLHKTDVGGVVLDLRTPDDVAHAWRTMEKRLGERMGGGLVQEMVEDGVDTIVGLLQHPAFGPIVLFGLGGTTTELLGDRAFHILPLTDVDARALVRGIRGAPLLFGYRGAPPAAVGALEELLLRVARLADDVPEVVEMDLNPVRVTPTRAIVLDAKLRLAPYRPAPEVRRLQRPASGALP